MAAAYQTQVQNIYLAYYGRPADPAGLVYWETQLLNANGNLSTIINAFATSAESTSLYGGLSTTQQVSAIYQALFGHQPDLAGLAYYVNGITTGTFTLGSVALNIFNGAAGTDATILAQKVAYSAAFTTAVAASVSAQNAYAGTTAAANARALVVGVTTAANEATAVTALPTSIANIGTGTVAQTFTLTTGVDNFTGPSTGNAVFIADNSARSGANAVIVSSAADTLTGQGSNNILKVYVNQNTTGAVNADYIGTTGGAQSTGSAEVLPTFTGIQTLWVSGANENAVKLDVSGNSGVTTVQLDSLYAGTTGTATVKVKGQALTLSNLTAATGQTETVSLTSTADTAANVTLSAVTAAGTGVAVLNIAGTADTTLNLTSSGSANKISLTDTGAALTTVNISGSQALTLTASTGTTALTTINASTETAAVTVDVSGVVLTTGAALAFTGGSGNNTLTLTEAQVAALTAGSQLNGGAGGSNTLTINSTPGAIASFSAADLKALNAVTNFQALGFSGTNTVAFAANGLTGAFAGNFLDTDSAALTITQMANNSTVTLSGSAAGGDTFSATTGAHNLNLNLGTASTAASQIIAAETVSTFNTFALSANGTGLTSAGAATFDSLILTNAANSSFTLTGNEALNLTVAATGTTTTGDSITASAFTGVLTLVDSGQGDVISTGSAKAFIKEVDIATAPAGNTITLLAGHTTVDTIGIAATVNSGLGTGAATTPTGYDVIKNFALGTDQFTTAANLSIVAGSATALTATTTQAGVAADIGAFTVTKGIVAASSFANATAFINAAEAAHAGATAGDLVAWVDATNGNTWVAELQGTGTGAAHIVELLGVQATSIATSGAGAIIAH